jgi:hypothetical protein
VPSRLGVRESENPMSTVKNEIQDLLKKLPDDCTLEDVQYHIYVLEKIRRGEDRAKNEGTLSQDEVEKRMSKWTSK